MPNESESKKRGLAVTPTFRSSATGFFVILPNLNRDFSMVVGGSKTTTAPTTAPTTVPTTVPVAVNGSKTDAEQLGKVAVKIYRMILANKRITAAKIATRMNLSENGVRYHLKRIKAVGLVRYVGNPQSGGHWEVLM